MRSTKKSELTIYFFIAVISILVLVIDALTPLGFAEWVLYVLPIALCTRQDNPRLPLLTTAALAPLLIIGFVLSPVGASNTVAIFNRTCAFVTIVGVAFLVRQIIVERLLAQHLMWLERGRAEVSRNMLGELTISEVSQNILHALARYFHAQLGVLYRLENNNLVHAASFAVDENQVSSKLQLGSGLIGEVARDGKPRILHDLPADYLRVSSATGNTLPQQIVMAPITVDGKVCGVFEFGFLRAGPSDNEVEMLAMVADKIGSAIRSAQYRENLQRLLEETQRQSEALQAQQEELRVSNEELEEQSRALMASQEKLENQQAELEQTNVQLEEQAERLEGQKRDLLSAQRELEATADELHRANQYKSEFLANMSHELRTPLNSSLILSKILMENKNGTLGEEQVRYAQTIHSSNNELLNLINDILDLSKIESGHAEIHPEQVAIVTVVESLRQMFDPVAREKNLSFSLEVGADTPQAIVTDSQRLHQILKNLLSNAFKFTERGEVVVHIAPGSAGRVSFSVRDSGIGIHEQQQEVIFKAFRQADGTTSRKYGGTGLGLSISRELARLLGGEIHLQSAVGLGSTFILDVPADMSAQEQTDMPVDPVARNQPDLPSVIARVSQPRSREPDQATARPARADDRFERKRERLILAIEDDPHFGSILFDLVHELDFDCVLATTGSEAIGLAAELRPSAILLDIGLPDQSGMSVLERLKRDPVTRHIPVHIISAEDHAQTALEMGAVGYALKPVLREDLTSAIRKLEERLQKRAHKVLVIEDDAALRENIALLLKADDIHITTAGTSADALKLISAGTFDCMVMDLNLPDSNGYDLLEQISSNGKYAFPPVIVYTGSALSRDDEQRLRRYSRSIIIKGAKSPERLVDEVTLFLHRVEASIPADQRKLLMQARQRDTVFEGRRILLAEDDIRNIFALTSVFEPLGAKIEIARNGREALEILDRDAAIDLVLMDLMMPEMDGLTAMREIRRQPKLARLPVIALTAKAMPDDRRSCLEAGASDYIAKPIDVDKLLSLCRVWMPK